MIFLRRRILKVLDVLVFQEIYNLEIIATINSLCILSFFYRLNEFIV